MANKAIYTVPYRRKRDGKTHFKKRLELLKSNQLRLVVRKSNTSVTVQFVEYVADGDKVLVTYNSSQLEKSGWKFSTKSIPACYLAGLSAGKQASTQGITQAILDLGLQTPHKGSRLYAVLQGVIDAGITVPADESVFPTQERLSGQHIGEEVTKAFTSLQKKLQS